ncbi:hypothetical protein A2Y83_03200 [Candidatus Falkowbacteria bacterium RBG_13_39_14]|uniref:Uncharacterized protein n=1 Tax=Candidatus Falkowbacteria bacterium RBG_13_39_14 TaxID=1797985 RepID=A0A1F5S607_9BACT|nr:MAG: hypothetical protein A2Y83_03200 [Candidatus Falkowbacteria bacterium RBG_13_39_14]
MKYFRVIPNAACGGGIPWRERWTRYSALIQGIPRRFAPRDDARLCAEGLIYEIRKCDQTIK